MKTKSIQSFMLFLVLGLLAGCGTGGDWPNLSDKIPDPADRNRVIERAEPKLSERPADTVPITNDEAQALMAEIVTDASRRQAEYHAALGRFTAYQPTPPAPDDTTHLWLETQLALTRFSQTISRLNTILDSALPANSEHRLQATAEKTRLEAIVVTERNTLADLDPAQPH